MNCDPTTLMSQVQCLRCIPAGSLQAIKTYLICQLANEQAADEPEVFITNPTEGQNFPEGSVTVDVTVIANGHAIVGIDYLEDGLLYATQFIPPFSNTHPLTSGPITLTAQLVYDGVLHLISAPVHITMAGFYWMPKASVNDYTNSGGPHTTDMYNMTLGADKATITNITGTSGGITSLNSLISLPALDSIDMSNNAGFTELHAANCFFLTLVDTTNSPVNLVDVTGCVFLATAIFNSCALSAAEIDVIAGDIRAAALFNAGTLDVSGPGNDPPPPASLLPGGNIFTLINTGGWTVLHN